MGEDESNAASQRRELAEQIRGDHRRSSRKLQILTTAIVIVAVIAAAGAVLMFRALSQAPDEAVAAPNNATDDFAFVLTPPDATATTETTRVDVYEDFLCSTCRIFHERTGAYLAGQVQSGTITLVYRPLAFLNNEAGDDYSVRAANAAACVADEAGVGGYAAMHALLMTNQPAYDQPGLTDETLTALAGEAGATGAAECIADGTFVPWVEAATQSAIRMDVHETPTVRVDGLGVVKSDDGVVTIPGEAEIQFAIEALR